MLLGSPVTAVEQEEHIQRAHITLHSELANVDEWISQPHWQSMHDQ